MNGTEWVVFQILWGIYAGIFGGHFAYSMKFPNKSVREIFDMMLQIKGGGRGNEVI